MCEGSVTSVCLSSEDSEHPSFLLPLSLEVALHPHTLGGLRLRLCRD